MSDKWSGWQKHGEIIIRFLRFCHFRWIIISMCKIQSCQEKILQNIIKMRSRDGRMYSVSNFMLENVKAGTKVWRV